MLKKTILTIITLLLFNVCNAQVKAPVQTDTLFIEDMQYHFEVIRPENWPFQDVVRTASSFVFGEQEFCIRNSKGTSNDAIFWLENEDGSENTLEMRRTEDYIEIEFSGYKLNCKKSDEISIDLKEYSEAGMTSVILEGRNLTSSLSILSSRFQEEGTVVVTIWVDNYGNVAKAVARAEGTTIHNPELLKAASDAAMMVHFNQKADAPALQEGTITFLFELQKN